MAKKLKFPLILANDVQVRSLDELQKNFDLEKIIVYYTEGKLQAWLSDRYYDDKVQALENLNEKDVDFVEKLCVILEVNESLAKDSIADFKVNGVKKAILKKWTSDENILNHLEQVAMNQEELEVILQGKEKAIYLCGEHFQIPSGFENRKYIQVKECRVVFNFA